MFKKNVQDKHLKKNAPQYAPSTFWGSLDSIDNFLATFLDFYFADIHTSYVFENQS